MVVTTSCSAELLQALKLCLSLGEIRCERVVALNASDTAICGSRVS